MIGTLFIILFYIINFDLLLSSHKVPIHLIIKSDEVIKMNMKKGVSQLTLQTLSLVAGFMAWSIISPLMPFISQDVDISPGQISVILAIPVILGSVLRVPFGYLTNIVGAKWVFFWSFIVLLLPIFL